MMQGAYRSGKLIRVTPTLSAETCPSPYHPEVTLWGSKAFYLGLHPPPGKRTQSSGWLVPPGLVI